jgi:hypothetical protein
MAKDWANTDKYHPSNGVLGPRMQMPRVKVICEDGSGLGRSEAGRWWADRGPLVRPVQIIRMLGLVQVVVVQVVGMKSLQVVSLLDVLHLVLNTRVREVVVLGWRGRTIHGLPFVAFILLQLERVGSFIVVTVVVFVVVSLIGMTIWFVLTPL